MSREDTGVALIVTGHARSGTSLLWTLCNQHPDIRLTLEFGNFRGINSPTPAYLLRLGSGWLRRANLLQPVLHKPSLKPWECRLRNHTFFFRYAWKIIRAGKPVVDGAVISSAMKDLLKDHRIVGDKYPNYIFSLDKLVGNSGLSLLVIYRDCRDVVSSVLKKVRTEWSSFTFARNIDTAPKIALHWMQAIETMELFAAHLYIIRYEDLVRHPEDTLAALGAWLDVDPKAFPAGWVRDASIGKYKTGLTDQELRETLDIAGPTMQRFGYV